MLESEIERAACKHAMSKGWLAYKWTSPGRAGVPDRIMITPAGDVFFMEVKAPTGRLSGLQIREHKVLRKNNVEVFTVYGLEQAKELIDNYDNKKGPNE